MQCSYKQAALVDLQALNYIIISPKMITQTLCCFGALSTFCSEKGSVLKPIQTTEEL